MTRDGRLVRKKAVAAECCPSAREKQRPVSPSGGAAANNRLVCAVAFKASARNAFLTLGKSGKMEHNTSSSIDEQLNHQNTAENADDKLEVN